MYIASKKYRTDLIKQEFTMLTPKFQDSIAYAILLSVFITSSVLAETKQTSGWVEKVAVSDPKMVFPTKINTNTKNSSIHTKDFKIFTKQNKD